MSTVSITLWYTNAGCSTDVHLFQKTHRRLSEKPNSQRKYSRPKTVIGKAEPTTFVFEPAEIEPHGEASALPIDQTNRISTVDLSDTSSDFSSFD